MVPTAAFALSLIVNVTAPADVPVTIVTSALSEADAIWRASGTTFVWRVNAALPSLLHVTIGREEGAARDAALPLGWVTFEDDQTPQPEIHLSYANAERLLENVYGESTRALRNMTPAQHHMLISRAMGRALAHELGHYLLASKVHTQRGLMQASRTASEFFAPDAVRFEISAAQRSQIATRLGKERLVASR